MEKSIQQLQSIIGNYAVHLNGLPEDEWIHKPNPAKWSKKEVLGHLIDSAQNNIRRFLVAQYDDRLKLLMPRIFGWQQPITKITQPMTCSLYGYCLTGIFVLFLKMFLKV
ncbi:MAG TPA: DinB family protein [Chitinophagaceae bacterium]|nr:DinB family protein [Chitinophagaceae bacterium]